MKAISAVIVICFLSFLMGTNAKAIDNTEYFVIKEPKVVTGPHPVTAEEWTEIVKRLKLKPKETEPFRNETKSWMKTL